MCRIISIVNMKGGVGKSTTAVNLGIGLAKQGKKVLLLDCDSQGSLTASLGFRKPSLLEPSIATVMASIIEEDEIQDGCIKRSAGTLEAIVLSSVPIFYEETTWDNLSVCENPPSLKTGKMGWFCRDDQGGAKCC